MRRVQTAPGDHEGLGDLDGHSLCLGARDRDHGRGYGVHVHVDSAVQHALCALLTAEVEDPSLYVYADLVRARTEDSHPEGGCGCTFCYAYGRHRVGSTHAAKKAENDCGDDVAERDDSASFDGPQEDARKAVASPRNQMKSHCCTSVNCLAVDHFAACEEVGAWGSKSHGGVHVSGADP